MNATIIPNNVLECGCSYDSELHIRYKSMHVLSDLIF